MGNCGCRCVKQLDDNYQDEFNAANEIPLTNLNSIPNEPFQTIYNEDENLKYTLHQNEEITTQAQSQHHVHRFIWQSNFSSPVEELLRKGNARVLDVGCGEGPWVLDLASEFQWSLFTGVDVSPVFDHKIGQLNATFIKADVLNGLPFDPDTFDFVHVGFVPFSEKQWQERIARELVRMCKPGGWIEVMDNDNEICQSGLITKKLDAAYRGYLTVKSENNEPLINPRFEEYLTSTGQIINIKREEKSCNLGSRGGQLGIHLVQEMIAKWERAKEVMSELMGVTIEEFNAHIRTFEKEVNDSKTYIKYLRVYGQKSSN
ncbi:674_t:CDS:2 [Acaulospora morrowiae]|uniref:674_t:CDS:1 n=1 Tax=Acaulospora morrowiae TaxID=94023 RepID=A0A9N8VLK8_9GLOM|nr:674_t:CDS:2 [Acaulospora morrowiae]